MKLKANKFILSCILSVLLFPLASTVMADGETTDPTPTPIVGCAMAHCDGQMSDNPGLPAPDAPSGLPSFHKQINYVPKMLINPELADFFPELANIGSYLGLGCVSNGSLAACSFFTADGAVKVFDHNGEELWNSGDLVNSNTWMSAPIIDENNSVIAADNKFIIRFDQEESKWVPSWKAIIPDNGLDTDTYPISPIVNDKGIVLVGTRFGPVLTYKPHEINPDEVDVPLDAKWVCYSDWNPPGEKFTLEEGINPCPVTYFHVDNTPAFRGDGQRVYITMANANKYSPSQGALVALNVDPNSGELSLAWAWEYTSPSGASPLVVEKDGLLGGRPVIYFDGRQDHEDIDIDVAKIFAIADLENTEDTNNPKDEPKLLWSRKVPPPPAQRIKDLPINRYQRWMLEYLLPEYLRKTLVSTTIDTSFTDDRAHDCFWYFANTWQESWLQESGTDTSLRCLSYEDLDGDGNGTVLMEINPGALFDAPGRYVVSGLPSMTIARKKKKDDDPDPQPQLIFNVVGLIDTGSNIDLSEKRDNKIVAVTPLLPSPPITENDCKDSDDCPVRKDCVLNWVEDLPQFNGPHVLIGTSKSTAGQFAFFAEDPTNPGESATRIIFTTVADGVHIIGDDFGDESADESGDESVIESVGGF